MNKEEFISFLTQDGSSTGKAALEIKQLSALYPYSQALHNITARLAKDHQWANQKAFLEIAAVFATDRAVLKEVMLQPHVVETTKTISSPAIAEKQYVQEIQLPPIDIASELVKDLKRLKKLKSDFELMYETFPYKAGYVPAVRTPSEKPRPKREDPIMSEIKAKKKIKPVSARHEEQLAVIEKFIKTKPVRKKPSPDTPVITSPEPEDFTENIVSETLVEILVKQDKKEKAIEVLKKLIWKFPQKKAYFAARIEDLKR